MRANIMAVLLYITVMLSMVYSCPPPFNDFKYADNHTLLHEAITQSNSDPTLGWAHVIGGQSPATPWPANNQGVVIIPYCFTDQWTKSKLESNFGEAWKRWYNKIGDPGAQTGHRLGGFKEVSSKKGPELCYRDKKLKHWNKKVPADALVVTITLESGGSSATHGYIPDEWSIYESRHQLRIGWHNNPKFTHDQDVFKLAHEMGHVFGFGHEHQRPDRDSYVRFQCENLAYYNTAVAKLADDPYITIEELCKSPMASREEAWSYLGFAPHEFSIEPGWDAWRPDGESHKYKYLTGKKYDYDSIMHYSSEIMAAPHVESLSVPRTLKNVPMVRWKEGKEGYKPPEKVTEENAVVIVRDFKNGPSDGDLEGIKNLYPWGG